MGPFTPRRLEVMRKTLNEMLSWTCSENEAGFQCSLNSVRFCRPDPVGLYCVILAQVSCGPFIYNFNMILFSYATLHEGLGRDHAGVGCGIYICGLN